MCCCPGPAGDRSDAEDVGETKGRAAWAGDGCSIMGGGLGDVRDPEATLWPRSMPDGCATDGFSVTSSQPNGSAGPSLAAVAVAKEELAAEALAAPGTVLASDPLTT